MFSNNCSSIRKWLYPSLHQSLLDVTPSVEEGTVMCVSVWKKLQFRVWKRKRMIPHKTWHNALLPLHSKYGKPFLEEPPTLPLFLYAEGPLISAHSFFQQQHGWVHPWQVSVKDRVRQVLGVCTPLGGASWSRAGRSHREVYFTVAGTVGMRKTRLLPPAVRVLLFKEC